MSCQVLLVAGRISWVPFGAFVNNAMDIPPKIKIKKIKQRKRKKAPILLFPLYHKMRKIARESVLSHRKKAKNTLVD
jgi:hypothetical protein